MKKYGFLLLGTLFGFLLSRAGATTQDFYAKLFLFQDLQLLWVILSAVSVGVLGIALLRRFKITQAGTAIPLSFQAKSMRPNLIWGSLIFGIGWGISGACPGTALSMLGEGKLMALFCIIGIAIGTLLYGYTLSARDKTQPANARGKPIQQGH